MRFVRGVGNLTPKFFSDWATQTPGTSADTKGDLVLGSRKWEDTVGGGGEIVAATGLDFPAAIANAYYARDNELGSPPEGFNFVRTESLSVPGIGDTRYYRWYFRCVMPDGISPSETHPIQDGFSAPTSNWQMRVQNGTTNGKWTIGWWSTGTDFPNRRFTSPLNSLDKSETYRIEFAISRTGTTTYTMHARVFDETGVLVLDDSDFKNDYGPDEYLSDNPSLLFADVNYLNGLNAGCNGSGSNVGPYAYEAGFAVADNQGWVGAYGSVAGEA
jgi:hypothetical protein